MEDNFESNAISLKEETDDNNFEIVEVSDLISEDGTIRCDETDASSTTTVYNCKSCNKTFLSVAQHMRDYHQDEEVVIEMEDEKSDPGSNFGFEEVSDDEQSPPCFKCEVCNTVLKNGRSLKLHMRIHERKDDGKTNISRVQHLCTLCNRNFSTDEHLQLHLAGHDTSPVVNFDLQPTRSKGYPCNYCGKEFKRPYEKVKHERIHTGERPYSCDTCGKTFRVQSCLAVHQRTHDDSRPYVCSHCKKRFKVVSAYNHHLKTHSDERNYQCTFCLKSFKTAVQLHGHKNSHTKPFSCSECNRPFGSLYAVRKHMQVHQQKDNKLAHGCDICGASYARVSALRDHRRGQHGVESADETASSVGEEEEEETVEIDTTSEIIVDESLGLKVESEEIIEEEDILF